MVATGSSRSDFRLRVPVWSGAFEAYFYGMVMATLYEAVLVIVFPELRALAPEMRLVVVKDQL